jgi:uncharacterized protein
MKIIDCHTHAFPDALAERAVPALEKEGHAKAMLDGKVASLLKSMDEAGIERSVICSIATKPEQFNPILKWSRQIASERLIPLASIHPRDAEAAARVKAVREEGLKGIKLHPYYQDFVLDEDRMLPIYEEIQAQDLILLCHTGFDIAFPKIRRADAPRIANVMRLFPRLKFIATHLGAWHDWELVREHLIGREIYIEISFSLDYMTPEEARELLTSHSPDYLLFGTDSPWAGQKESVAALRALNLGEELERKIFCDNARKLLQR